MRRDLQSLMVLAALSGVGHMPTIRLEARERFDPWVEHSFLGRRRWKRRTRVRNVLRGYYTRYSNVLTPSTTEAQLAKSKFKGFRKVRQNFYEGGFRVTRWVSN